MARFFELEDQRWFPKVLRDGITDYLRYAVDRIDMYDPVVPVIIKWLKRNDDVSIVDLCSGAGGGILKIHEKLKSEGLDIRVVLTDKFPNKEAYEIIQERTKGEITFRADSVDALNIPNDLCGPRTMFVSFHHFNPDKAMSILEKAKRDGMSIAVFEFTERNILNFILNFFAPVVVMIAVLFMKPFKWGRFFFTYVIPLIPLSVMWDGFVSVLRTYTVEELEEMVRKIGSEGYRWEVGKLRGRTHVGIIYLVGYPVRGIDAENARREANQTESNPN